MRQSQNHTQTPKYCNLTRSGWLLRGSDDVCMPSNIYRQILSIIFSYFLRATKIGAHLQSPAPDICTSDMTPKQRFYKDQDSVRVLTLQSAPFLTLSHCIGRQIRPCFDFQQVCHQAWKLLLCTFQLQRPPTYDAFYSLCVSRGTRGVLSSELLIIPARGIEQAEDDF